MNRALSESFDRMIDGTGRYLEWRGRWVVHQMPWAEPPVLPATYPRWYYKVGTKSGEEGA